MLKCNDKIGCLSGIVTRVGESLKGNVARIGESLVGSASLVCVVNKDRYVVFECSDGTFILADNSEFLVIKEYSKQ
jgi:hypothetical protein